MIISFELAEWILSAIIQAQSAIMGLNLATISISVAFLYRNGEFYKYPDSLFIYNYPNFRKNVKLSLSIGFFTILISLFGLLTLETLNSNYHRVLFCYVSSSLILSSIACSLLAGASILRIINNHISKANEKK